MNFPDWVKYAKYIKCFLASSRTIQFWITEFEDFHTQKRSRTSCRLFVHYTLERNAANFLSWHLPPSETEPWHRINVAGTKRSHARSSTLSTRSSDKLETLSSCLLKKFVVRESIYFTLSNSMVVKGLASFVFLTKKGPTTNGQLSR